MATTHTQVIIKAIRPAPRRVRFVFCRFIALKPHSRKKSPQNEGDNTKIVARFAKFIQDTLQSLVDCRRLHQLPLITIKQEEYLEIYFPNEAIAKKVALWLGTVLLGQKDKKNSSYLDIVSMSPKFYD